MRPGRRLGPHGLDDFFYYVSGAVAYATYKPALPGLVSKATPAGWTAPAVVSHVSTGVPVAAATYFGPLYLAWIRSAGPTAIEYSSSP